MEKEQGENCCYDLRGIQIQDSLLDIATLQAPPDVHIQWDIKAIKGVDRWLNRIWSLTQEHVAACGSCSTTISNTDRGKKLVSAQHHTIKQVKILFRSLHL